MRHYIGLCTVIFISACIQSGNLDLVIQNKDNYLGKEIKLSGIIDNSKIICTHLSCKSENPCCNTCSSGILLKSGESEIEIRGAYEGSKVSCLGSECGLECHPMQSGKKYFIVGTLQESYNELYIELKSFRGVE
jgi:hypothetical protein